MGEATGLAKGLRGQFGVEPDLDICGRRGATVVLPAATPLDFGAMRRTIEDATYTLTAIHLRVRGRVTPTAGTGAVRLVLRGSAQELAVRDPARLVPFAGRTVEVVATVEGIDTDAPTLAILDVVPPPAPTRGSA